MKKNVNKNTLLLFVFLAVVFSLTSFILSLFPTQNTIQGGATSQTTTLSITIVDSDEEEEVGEDGECHFDDDKVNDVITEISGLTSGWRINASLFGESFPSSWTERQPNSTEAGATKIEFFEIKINATTAGGNYNISFNVTSAELGSLPVNNISLFVFNDTGSTWQNLSTVVANANTDPRQLYGITPHFSKFLIAQKPAVSGSGSGSGDSGSDSGSGSSSGSGGGGGGGGSSSSKKTTKPSAPSKPEAETEEIPLPEPVHKPGVLFDVSLNIPEKYRKLLPGQELVAEIYAINVKSLGSVTVKVEHTIKNKEGEVLFQEVETKVIENEIKYLKSVQLSKDILPGAYMFFTEVKYENDTALAGYPFQVIEEKKPLFGLAVPLLTYKQALQDYGIYMIGFAAFIVILLAVIHFIKRRRIPKLVFIRGREKS